MLIWIFLYWRKAVKKLSPLAYRRLTIIWFVLCIPIGNVWAQEDELRSYSFPPLYSFSDSDYESYIQNWGVAQDTSGIIYIANVGNVLEFDGVQWNNIAIENSRALSIAQGDEGHKLYVGGIGSLGYLEKSATDTSISPTYITLNSSITDSSFKLTSIWNIISSRGSIYFRQREGLLHLNDKVIDVIKPKNAFSRVFQIHDKIFAFDEDQGIYTVEDTSTVPLASSEQLMERKVMLALPYKTNSWLVADLTLGLSIFDGKNLIPLQSEVDRFLVKNKVYSGLTLPDSTYLFGTLNGGIVQVDKKGRLLRKIDSESGLHSDQVHSLFLDQANNVWAALGNGLSLIEPMSPISYLDERSGLSGTVIDITVLGKDLYVSTEEGLFQLNINQENGDNSVIQFNPVSDQLSKCYKIIQYKGELIANCSDSLYRITEDKVIKFHEGSNIQIVKEAILNQDRYFVLSRNNFQIFDGDNTPIFQNSNFRYEFTSLIQNKNGDLWIGTVANGIFRIESEFFDSLENFDAYLHHYNVPHEKDNHSLQIFNISGEAVIGSSSGLYRYDTATDSLVRDHRFGEEMADSERQIFLMEEDTEGNIWVRSNREHQVLLKEEDGYKYAEGGLKRIDANQVNRIYTHESGLVWMATDEGIIQYDPSKDPYLQGNSPEPFKTHVRGVYVRGDSLINADLKNKGYELKYEDNELRFQYAAAQYKAPSETRYQIWLEGFEEGWSDWTSEVQKDYTNIPEGYYTFHVRARDVYGTISQGDTFSFQVFPPWYRTWWAYALYVLLVGGLLYGLHRIRINRILREQRIRNRIASDLHDEVSATLSSITYFAEAIRQVPEEEQAERFVGLISESAGEAKEKITDIIWSIDPEKDDWIDLLSKCRRFASDLLESKGIDYELDIDTDINRSLDLEMRQHLWLIFKELVVNAARHSEASHVDIRFGMEENILTMIVADNGIGMESVGHYKDGHGVKNIQQRAEKIGADIELKSDASTGTRWKMVLDL